MHHWNMLTGMYYEVYGEMRLRKAVSVALCIVNVTLALIAVKYIPMDINNELVDWLFCDAKSFVS